jgi:hypothetical protein
MKKTVTLNSILIFNNVANTMLNRSNDKKSQFLYALQKVQKRVKSIIEDYQEELAEKQIDLAATDKDGFIIQNNEGVFKFSTEKQKELNLFVKNRMKEKCEIEPYLAKDDINIDLLTRDALTPFVFEEIEENELLEDFVKEKG